MVQRFKEDEQKEDDDSFDAGFKIPETKSVTDGLIQAIQQEHKLETEENEKQGKAKKQKRGGSICFCMDPNCRIGEFVELK